MSNNTLNNNDYKVADMTLADFGRKESERAEVEMPALMALRAKYSAQVMLSSVRPKCP
jgi:adenosylhomocysteinase